MTRDEIMGMDDRELYERIAKWLGEDAAKADSLAQLAIVELRVALELCYQAEEKIINELSKGERWVVELAELVDFRPHEFIWFGHLNQDKFAHADPSDRARAVLLTINEKEK